MKNNFNYITSVCSEIGTILIIENIETNDGCSTWLAQNISFPTNVGSFKQDHISFKGIEITNFIEQNLGFNTERRHILENLSKFIEGRESIIIKFNKNLKWMCQN